MFEFFSITSRGTHECLPCGLQWRKLVELLRKKNSKFYWYDFTVRGQRYRGSTKETNITRALTCRNFRKCMYKSVKEMFLQEHCGELPA
jgi:hypothetical protein